MNEIEDIAKFHEYIFGKNPAVMWEHLKQQPLSALQAILELGKNPLNHSLETGFIMGTVLMYGLKYDYLAVKKLLDAMSFEMKVKKHVGT
jgi:hypothetical protein